MKDRDFERSTIRLTNIDNDVSGYQICSILPAYLEDTVEILQDSVIYHEIAIMISVETVCENMQSYILDHNIRFDLDIEAQIYVTLDLEFNKSGQLVATRLNESQLEIERLERRVKIIDSDYCPLNEIDEDELLAEIPIEDIILNNSVAREIIYKLINDARFELIANE